MAEGSNDDDEEQLRLAIALSLQDQPTVNNGIHSMRPDTPKEIIDINSSDDDGVTSTAKLMAHPASIVKLPERAHGTILGLDRRAMEAERLARKRKASASPPPRKHRGKHCPGMEAPGPVKDLPTPMVPKALEGPEKVSITMPHTESSTQGPKYPNGIVRKTWAYGFPRHEDIKIEEVFERNDLNLAVLSSFQWDVEWVLGKLNAASTKMIFVMQAKEQSTREQYERETASMPNLRLCFPSMEGQVNCMHSKLMLLAHPTYLRIVVPSANLVPYDWGETGVMENMVFVIDLPRLEGNRSARAEDMTFFGRELIYFLQAMGLQQEIVGSVYNFDFTATKDYAFVHTIGGAHGGDTAPWRRTGYCGLGRAVRELGLSTDQEVYADMVTSSIGAVNRDFLAMLYLAAQGDDGLKEYEWRTSTPPKSQSNKRSVKSSLIPAGAPDGFFEQLEENFRIFFPSQETVERSRGGVGCGGPICFSSRWYNAATFPQRVLRDCKSRREGLLMHNKVWTIWYTSNSRC